MSDVERMLELFSQLLRQCLPQFQWFENFFSLLILLHVANCFTSMKFTEDGYILLFEDFNQA